GVRPFGIEPPRAAVHHRSGPLDAHDRIDEGGIGAQPRDREVRDGAGRLRAVERLRRHLDGAERITLEARACGHGASTRSMSGNSYIERTRVRVRSSNCTMRSRTRMKTAWRVAGTDWPQPFARFSGIVPVPSSSKAQAISRSGCVAPSVEL